MTEALKNILTGMGSVVDVFPKSDYGKHIPTETAEDRMRGHWTRTGEHLERSMNRFAYEQQEQKEEKAAGS
jgi:phosphopentomutase